MLLSLIEDSGNCLHISKVLWEDTGTYVDIALYRLPRVRLSDDMVAYFCYGVGHCYTYFLTVLCMN